MSNDQVRNKAPWNKGKLVGQKLPLKLKKYGQSGFAYSSLETEGIWLSISP